MSRLVDSVYYTCNLNGGLSSDKYVVIELPLFLVLFVFMFRFHCFIDLVTVDVSDLFRSSISVSN